MKLISGHEKEQFIVTMQDAFLEDPLYRFLSDDLAVRKKVIRIIFDMITNNDYGTQYINNKIPNAGAVWLHLGPKGHKSLIKSIQLQLRLILSGCIQRFVDMNKPFQKMEAKQKELYQSSDAYLSLLFVSPDFQNQGIASLLLTPELERFDRENLICSLDTFNQRNIPFYEKFGFKLVSEIHFNEHLTNYQMQRRPRSNA
ncbi:GNAT family N-acetyltransferase [Photobacterium sp. MCCC 1A19761]|uniref:GNAT family N-acetyltransferase n=1 Tax=Photobacterium sp. MCCC 1A19761 TaxID=3115000 RepID=UPI00307E3165